jgi:hypothetical protein
MLNSPYPAQLDGKNGKIIILQGMIYDEPDNPFQQTGREYAGRLRMPFRRLYLLFPVCRGFAL